MVAVSGDRNAIMPSRGGHAKHSGGFPQLEIKARRSGGKACFVNILRKTLEMCVLGRNRQHTRL